MNSRRIAAGLLSLILLALLGWSLVAGVGNLRIHMILCVGATLGAIYTAVGRVPFWIIDHSDGSITDDDDPDNISPGVYLPILFGAVLIAVTVFVVVVILL